MDVYTIICTDKSGNVTAISGECYAKYDDAVKFIQTRSGNPVKHCDDRYDTDDTTYLIKPLDVK